MKTLGLGKTGFAVGIVLVLALWTLVLYILLADEELSVDSKKLLEKPFVNSGAEAYYFLMGFDVAADDDPVKEGKKLAEKIKIENNKYLNEQTETATVSYPEHKKIVIAGEAIFCKYWEDNCYKTIFENAPLFNEKLQNHILITERLEKFLSFKTYQTITQNTIIEPKPPYKLTTNASRLILIHNIKLASLGMIDQAEVNILEHIKKLRTALLATDDLIGKMVFLSQLAESIDVLAVLHNKYNAMKPFYIDELTGEELSLESALKNEFRGIYHLYQSQNNSKNFWSTSIKLPTFVNHLAFKPNMTINYLSEDMENLIDRSKLLPFQNNTETSTPTFSIFNVAGASLYLLSRNVFDEYLPRTRSINIKIALLNSVFSDKNLQGNTVELINPFYGTQEKAEYRLNKICLKGPIEDKRGFNCLQLNY